MTAWIIILVLLVVVLGLAAFGMRTGWRNRARRQSEILPEFAEPPAAAWQDEPVLPTAEGVYVGSTLAGDWQDRVAVGDVGFRANAALRLTRSGLLVERAGASPLWVAAEKIVGARRDAALAGKVMGGDGLLVVRWRHGERELDTGFRGDDRSTYEAWIEAVTALARAPGETPGELRDTRGGGNGGNG